jgi:hypothetical protein
MLLESGQLGQLVVCHRLDPCLSHNTCRNPALGFSLKGKVESGKSREYGLCTPPMILTTTKLKRLLPWALVLTRGSSVPLIMSNGVATFRRALNLLQ